MTGPGTNTYLVGIDEIAVIDPGPDDCPTTSTPSSGCGGDRIRWIVCTHTHPDHSPGAAGLKARTGAEVMAFDARDGLEVDRKVTGRHRDRGHRVPPPGHPHARPRLQPPVLPARRGAHAVLGRPHHAGLDRGHQPARRQHGRLPRVAGHRAGPAAALDRTRPRPPHRGAPRRPSTTTSSTARPASSRSSTCSTASGTTKIDDLVEVIYVDVDPRAAPGGPRTVHAHLLKLAKEGKAKGRSIDGKWSAV